MWQQRRLLQARERVAFWKTLRREEWRAQQDQGETAGTDRIALTRALVAHGLLTFSRHRAEPAHCIRCAATG